MTATTITYGGIPSSDIPELYVVDVARQITPGIRDVYVDVPGRDGAWMFPEAAGDRKVAATIAIVGDSIDERRAAVRKAARWLWQPGARRPLIISDEPDRFYLATLAGPIDSDEALTLGRFSVEWRTGPYPEDVSVDTDTVTGTDTVTVTASDDLADTLYPSVEVTAAGALASGFTLTVNGVALIYGAAVAAAGKVTISAISSTVTTGADTDTDLDGTFTVANLAMTSVSGEFPRLVPGSNTVTITGGATAVLRWRRRYV